MVVDIGELMAKKQPKKVDNDKRQTIIVVVAVVTIALMVVVALIYSNNPFVFNRPEVIGPDPSIPRSVTDDGLHYLGSSDAPIKIRIYEDYACPNCKKFFDNTEPLLFQNYVVNGKVGIEIYPVAIVNSRSLPAAEAVYCADEQGYYWEYRQIVYANQGNRVFDRDTFGLFGDVVGLDVDAFLDCYDQGKYQQQIADQSQAAQQFGIMGTPTFEINGKRYPGPGETSIPNIFEILDNLLLEVEQ
jgi:protein-disulfide isomerase